ncbi:MAG: methyl-accepting chemotaxis protein [Muribaculaceae bacterium]|nr:methyl-accepting chemotaxis protein [Roseburia sp.]MCM1491859.1 methyl-accepting chemotaxis protein [Muribaculaceae bacterium]
MGKTNKAVKQKVKKEQVPKPKKEPKPKKNPAAKPGGGAKNKRSKEGAEVPFYKSISMKLIASFLVPVICIIVLGVTSYQRAATAVVGSYRSSVEQTVSMMQQYISLIISSEKDEFKNYLTDATLKKYFGGLMSDVEVGPARGDYQGKLRTKMSLDRKVKGAYFFADNSMTLDYSESVTAGDMYSAYVATAQGEKAMSSGVSWFVFGQDPDADAALNIDTEGYCIRIAKKYNDYKVAMVIDIDAPTVRSAMQSLDPGTGGYVSLITEDGVEFYSDGEAQPQGTLVYGTDFYQRALENSEVSGSETVTVSGTEYLFIYSKLQVGDNTMVAALIPQARLLAQTSEIKRLCVILTIVAAIIALVLGIAISNSMSGTIRYILRQLRKVAKGDLTVHLSTKRKDELGLLCGGVNDTVEHIKRLIVKVNEVSQQVGESAAYVASASGTFMETSQDIQSAVSEIEVGVNKLDSGSGDCLNQMDSLSGKINNVSSNAGEIEKLTNATGSTINTGISSVQGLTRSAESTAEITRNVIVSIEELEAKSKSIGNIVSAINEIAEQTNLLSLNASIEAARAGEAGRGFAVVAEEIRKLADQCLLSAGQIAQIVEEIVAQTGDVVEIAKQAESVVSSQSGAVEETTSSFRLIDKQVEELLMALQTISSNVQEMGGARNQTLSAIESISAVSAETAACSTSVYDAAGTQLKAIQDLDHASQQLAGKADSLLELLSTFQV